MGKKWRQLNLLCCCCHRVHTVLILFVINSIVSPKMAVVHPVALYVHLVKWKNLNKSFTFDNTVSFYSVRIICFQVSSAQCWVFLLVVSSVYSGCSTLLPGSGGSPPLRCFTVVQANLKPLGKWSVSAPWQLTKLDTNRQNIWVHLQTMRIVLRNRAICQH